VAFFPAETASAAGPVVVASKIDTEGALLGNMIADVVAARGIAVDRRIQLGPTNIVRAALLAGQIDLYPEYTGNGGIFFHRDNDPAWKNAAQGYDEVKKLDAAQSRIVWLDPAPANNTWVIAIRGDLPAFPGRKCLDSLAAYLAEGGRFKLAATLRAAAEGISGVNAGMAYGTDGELAALGLTALCDDKGAQIVYAPAPVIRQAVLDEHPDIAAALVPVFASLSLETLQALNARIAVAGEDAGAVAVDYLKSKHFLP
jgi:osmoprotectant transport system substrate-binding protein